MQPNHQGIAWQTRKEPTFEHLLDGYFGQDAAKQLKAAKKPTAGKKAAAANDCVSIHYVHDAASHAKASRVLEQYVSKLYAHAAGNAQGWSPSASFEDQLDFLADPERANPFAIGFDAGTSYFVVR